MGLDLFKKLQHLVIFLRGWIVVIGILFMDSHSGLFFFTGFLWS